MASTQDHGRACVFCGGRPVTVEHVWPQWVAELVREHTGVETYHLRVDDKRWTQGRLGFEVKRVCGPCNSGWMSRMETKVRSVLHPMIVGQRYAILSPADQASLCIECVLNGIAYDPATDRIFVTGKKWPKLFEIDIVK